MAHKTQWIYPCGTGFKTCPDGLCGRYNELKEAKKNPAVTMSKEFEAVTGKVWKAGAVQSKFDRLMRPSTNTKRVNKQPKPASPKKPAAPDLIKPTDDELDEVDMLKGYYDCKVAKRCKEPVPSKMDFGTALQVFEIPGCTTASARVVKAIFIMLSKVHHPDTPGGNADRMMELNVAYAVIRKFIKEV